MSKITLASKYADTISRFVLHFERNFTEGGMKQYKKETDCVLKPAEGGLTNHLLVNSKNMPWGTYTYDFTRKLKRANPEASEFVKPKELLEVLATSRKTDLMRGDIKIVVTDEIRGAIAEVMDEYPGVLNNSNFVNENVLKPLDFNISTTIEPIIKDEEVKSIDDIERKIKEAGSRAQETITEEVTST